MRAPGLRRCRALFLVLLASLAGLGPVLADDPNLRSLEALTPAEQHRQLSLMLLVSAGADDALMQTLAPLLAESDAAQAFDPEDYTTPLARIVDQRSLLAGAAQLFRFVRAEETALRARLDALEAEGVPADGEAGLASITEDTILIRKAIADAMASAGLEDAGEAASLRYQEQTVVLRNALEFAQFKAELDALTDQAIASVGGKLDAYQRMFDSETSSGTFDRRIRSAELIYLPEGQFDPRAGELTEEMLRNMVLMESQPHR